MFHEHKLLMQEKKIPYFLFGNGH